MTTLTDNAVGSTPEPQAGKSRRIAWPEHGTPVRHTHDVQLLSFADLIARRDEWRSLGNESATPNAFYEEWMLEPAIEWLPGGSDVKFIAAFRTEPDRAQRMCSLWPVVERPRTRGLPIRSWTLWRHPYCFLSTPLVRRECVDCCIHDTLAWIKRDRRSPGLIELACMDGDGPIAEGLTKAAAGLGYATQTLEHFERAALHRGESAEAYIEATLDRKKRKELRRQQNRLADLGPVSFRELRPEESVEDWIQQFLRLEAAGWKGRSASALAASESSERFFAEVCRRAHQVGRLMFLSLNVGNTPIAMKFNIIGGDCGFTLKIAFDEAYRTSSPGVQLELENIRRFHERSEIRWMDSCAEPDHFMANSLWSERRPIQSLLLGGRGLGRMLIRTWPVLSSLSRRWTAFKSKSPESAAYNEDGDRNSRNERERESSG